MSSTRPVANRRGPAALRSPGSGSTVTGHRGDTVVDPGLLLAHRRPVACWRSIARLMSSSAWNRSETSVRGSARAPRDDAWAARWVSRSLGTGHEANRRRSVHLFSMASSSSGASREGRRAPGRRGQADPAGRGRGGRSRWRTSPGRPRPPALVQRGAAADHQVAPVRVARRRRGGSGGVQLREWGSPRQRQGWVLCTLGARVASSASGAGCAGEPVARSSSSSDPPPPPPTLPPPPPPPLSPGGGHD